jgi:small conductance mechanosensitive channel
LNWSLIWIAVNNAINGLIAKLPAIVTALMIFIIFCFVARGIKLTVEHITQRYWRVRNVALALGRLSEGLFILLGLLIALVILFPTFTVGDLISLLGISGVAIGFAFRDILQNYLAGILLLLADPFEIGDQIIVNDFEGTVENIQVRATTIMTYDGRRVVIPNAVLYTQSVTVNTAFDKRRVQYDFSVDYNTNLEQAKQLMLQATQSAQGVLKEPAPDAYVVAVTPNGVTIRVRWWITPPRYIDKLDTQDHVLVAIKRTFVASGIQLPTPSQEIILENAGSGTSSNRHQNQQQG